MSSTTQNDVLDKVKFVKSKLEKFKEELDSLLKEITEIENSDKFKTDIEGQISAGQLKLLDAIKKCKARKKQDEEDKRKREKEEEENVNKKTTSKSGKYLEMIEKNSKIKFIDEQKTAITKVLDKYINTPQFKKLWTIYANFEKASYLFKSIGGLVKEGKVTEDDFEKTLVYEMERYGNVKEWLNLIYEYCGFSSNERNILSEYLIENYEGLITLYPTKEKLANDKAVLAQIVRIKHEKDGITKEKLNDVMNPVPSKRKWKATPEDWAAIKKYVVMLQKILSVPSSGFSTELKTLKDGNGVEKTTSQYNVVKRLFSILRVKNFMGFNDVYPNADALGLDDALDQKLNETIKYNINMDWNKLDLLLKTAIIGRLKELKENRAENQKEIPSGDNKDKEQNNSNASKSPDSGKTVKVDPKFASAEQLISQVSKEVNATNEKQKIFDEYNNKPIIKKIKDLKLGDLDDLRKPIEDTSVSPGKYKTMVENRFAELVKKRNEINKIDTDKKQRLFDEYNGNLSETVGRPTGNLVSLRALIDDSSISVDDYKQRLETKSKELVVKQNEITAGKERLFDENKSHFNEGSEEYNELGASMKDIDVSFEQFKRIITDLMPNQNISKNDTASSQTSGDESKNSEDKGSVNKGGVIEWNEVKNKVINMHVVYENIKNNLKKHAKFSSGEWKGFRDKYRDSFRKLQNLKISSINFNDNNHKLMLKGIFDLMMKMCGLDGGTANSKVSKYCQKMALLSHQSNRGEEFTRKTADKLMEIFHESYQLITGEQFFTGGKDDTEKK